MYKYDLGHKFYSCWYCSCCIIKNFLYRASERERERSLPPHCNRRRVWRRRKQEVVASVFSFHCIPLTHSLFYSLWAVVVFPIQWVFHVISFVLSLLVVSVHCNFVLTSYIRLWPNDLGNPFLIRNNPNRT